MDVQFQKNLLTLASILLQSSVMQRLEGKITSKKIQEHSNVP